MTLLWQAVLLAPLTTHVGGKKMDEWALFDVFHPTFAVAGSVRDSLESVKERGEGSNGGQKVTLERIALGDQQLHQGHTHLAK